MLKLITSAKGNSKDIDLGSGSLGKAESSDHVLSSNIGCRDESPSEQAVSKSSRNVFLPDYVSDTFVVHVLVDQMSHQCAPLY